MLNMKMEMHSIYLSKDILQDNSSIRVSITTLPEEQKQAKIVNVKDLNTGILNFKIQMNNKTEKVVIVFRRHGFLDEHIIASTTLRASEIKMFKEIIGSEHKQVDIYEPIQGKNNNQHKFPLRKEERRVVGSMEIEFSLIEEFGRQNYSINKEHKAEFKNSSYSKVDSLMKNQLNGNQEFLFVDPLLN